MEHVDLKAIKKAFPHGVTVAQDGEGQNFDLVRLDARKLEDGSMVVMGWAFPNKDFYFAPEEVVEKPDGDWLFKSEGRMYRFAPLSADRAKALMQQMDEF